MKNDITMNPVQEIIALHDEAIQLHHQATTTARRFVEIAVRAGALLTEKKKSLGHGQWLPWIEEHLPFSARTASRYMAAYEARNQLKSDTSMSDLTMAYQLLDTPLPPMSRGEAERSIASLRQALLEMAAALPEMNRFRSLRDEKAYAPAYPTFEAHLEAVGIDPQWFRQADDVFQKLTAWCQGGPVIDLLSALWTPNPEMGPPPWDEGPSLA